MYIYIYSNVYNKNIMSALVLLYYIRLRVVIFPLSLAFFIFIENPIRSRNDDDKITTVINNDLYIL